MTTKILGQYIDRDFTAYHGDNIEVVAGLPDDSIDLTVTSPPFASMYAFSNSERDIGNTTGIGQMIEHFRFLVRGMLRVTKPGRSCCIHLTNINAFMHRDGYVGRFDFRGDVIRLFMEEGWIYASEILIDKCPQMRQERSHDRGLQFKTLAKDSSMLAPVMADYLIVFRKKGANAAPIKAGTSSRYHQQGWITEEEWIDWAQAIWNAAEAGWIPETQALDTFRSIWFRHTLKRPEGGVRETDVLNARVARDAEDERHLAPLQLGVIERCVKLWSAPGDVVFDPFGGIGSTPYQAIKLGRLGLMAELKESYFAQAVRNCKRAVAEKVGQRSFLDDIDDPAPPDPQADIPTEECPPVEAPAKAPRKVAITGPPAAPYVLNGVIPIVKTCVDKPAPNQSSFLPPDGPEAWTVLDGIGKVLGTVHATSIRRARERAMAELGLAGGDFRVEPAKAEVMA